MDDATLNFLHIWLSEVFSLGNDLDKEDALNMLGALELEDKRSFWDYLGQSDGELQGQMKLVRAVSH